MTTIALVAAKDAAASIGATVLALRGLEGIDEVWVVDDGSTDDTADAAVAAGAHVVRLQRNEGKGGALAAGITATPHAGRYLLADADLGSTATGLRPLLESVSDDRVVVGVLPAAGGRGGFGLVQRLARAGIRRACGFDGRAPLSGQRIVDGDALRSVALAPRFGVEVGMTVDLVRRGLAVDEVPVDVDHQHRGRSIRGFAHRARQGRDIAGALTARLTTPAQRVVAVVVASLLVFAALSSLAFVRRAPQGSALPHTSRVLLFAYDRLSVEDLGREDVPAFTTLRERGASGALTVRTTDRRSLGRRSGPERPSLADAFASLGASARVRAAASIPAARALARHDHAAGLPGALGDALHAAGKRTAVVSTGDRGASLALADRHGDVDRQVEVPPAAFGGHLALAMADADVVIANPPAGQADGMLRRALADVPPDALVIVFSPTPHGRDWTLTPVVVVAPGITRGSIASSTTRRAAIGGIVDLAPTTLAALGLAVPADMTGAALRTTDHEPDFDALRRLDTDGAVRSRFFINAAVGYTVIALLYYICLGAAMLLHATARVRTLFRLGACAAAAFPLATLLQGGAQHWLHHGGESPLLLMTLSIGIGALVVALRGVAPVYVVAAAALGVLAVDVAAVGPLQSSTILGYSMQTTGRFSGMPNGSFAVFVGSLLLLMAAVGGRAPTKTRVVAAVAVLVVGVAFEAAPWLGNDIGGVLTLLPIGAASAWALLGRRFTPRVIVLGVLGVAAAFAVLTVAEAAVGGGSHLGRAAAAGASDSASLTNTLTRRVDANFGLLVAQWYGFISLPLALAGVVVLAVQHRWTDYLPTRSPLRVAAVAILAASVLGFLVNDSGPVVNVLCLVVLAPAMVLTALEGSP